MTCATSIASLRGFTVEQLAELERAVIHEILSRNGLAEAIPPADSPEIQQAREHLYSQLAQ